ncbi:alpha/beta hydrolase-fold protein [Haloglycomyces albus]|uniref:alpha/beta hydrolase-fold protein n=1 Tax=Haloglycomyces albus TaxID=526067 RepID=UPI001B7FA376|nr:alpha/beta hydrolase-fold protein [Haloglycomyces albus]
METKVKVAVAAARPTVGTRDTDLFVAFQAPFPCPATARLFDMGNQHRHAVINPWARIYSHPHRNPTLQEDIVNNQHLTRRNILKSAGGLSAAMALGTGGALASAAPAGAAGDGHGLHIVDHNEDDPRMWYYRFATDSIGWNPGVNVLLPDDYHHSGRTYPVLYLFHGGDQDFRFFDFEGIREWTAGKPIIVVMPDGGSAGWYSNPVTSNVGPRNWEHFHIAQLLPWVEANFRTYAEFNGRAVSGFSMGGFGALKYAAKYYGHFASVSSHSGPASLRLDDGAVVHWANLSSAAVELGGGTVYGVPWDENRVSTDNPVERVESYRHKRVFMAAGTSPESVWDWVNEHHVLNGQREFRGLLGDAGIPHEWHEVEGGHFVRHDLFNDDLDGIIARLRKA